MNHFSKIEYFSKYSPPRLNIFRLLHSHFQTNIVGSNPLPFQINMASSADAPMEPASINETIAFSEGAMVWLRANHQKLETMVQERQTMWNLEDWEEFERWAYSKTEELHEAQRKEKEAEKTQRRWQETHKAMQAERSQLVARIAQFEGGLTFSSIHPDYCRGMIALETLVCNATSELTPDGEIGRLPPDGGELIIERLDKLVKRMACVEPWRHDPGCMF